MPRPLLLPGPQAGLKAGSPRARRCTGKRIPEGVGRGVRALASPPRIPASDEKRTNDLRGMCLVSASRFRAPGVPWARAPPEGAHRPGWRGPSSKTPARWNTDVSGCAGSTEPSTLHVRPIGDVARRAPARALHPRPRGSKEDRCSRSHSTAPRGEHEVTRSVRRHQVLRGACPSSPVPPVISTVPCGSSAGSSLSRRAAHGRAAPRSRAPCARRAPAPRSPAP